MADNAPAPDPLASETPTEADSLDGGEENSLETTDPASPTANQDGSPDSEAPGSAPPEPGTNKKPNFFKRLLRRLNTPILLFILLVLVGAAIMLVAYLQNRKPSANNHFQAQGLSQQTLQQLANGDATVGSNQSILNVQSSAVFAGQVLIRQNLQVAGNLEIGGTVALSNIAVAGTSQFGQVNISKNLAVAGDSALQGALTIGKSLQVNGNGTFSGPLSAPQITTSTLQLNGDLSLTHHLIAGGATPGRTNGTALGSGGSVSVSGSDTAGSVSINTGSGPAAGCFVTVNFTAHYNATPHVLVTPVGSAAGGLSYYVNRSSTSFSICDNSAPPAGSSFGFDYFVVD